MFETTGSTTAPVSVHFSFWQCLKAGAAFTAGGLMVGFIASLVWFVIAVRVLPLVMLRALQS